MEATLGLYLDIILFPPLQDCHPSGESTEPASVPVPTLKSHNADVPAAKQVISWAQNTPFLSSFSCQDLFIVNVTEINLGWRSNWAHGLRGHIIWLRYFWAGSKADIQRRRASQLMATRERRVEGRDRSQPFTRETGKRHSLGSLLPLMASHLLPSLLSKMPSNYGSISLSVH